MPAQPIHLGRLTAYMAQVSNSSNSWAIADVANATGISKDTVRRLFEGNTDLFYCAPKAKGPAEYFYVPSERGQRIIDKAHTAHVGVPTNSAPKVPVADDIPVPAKSVAAKSEPAKFKYINDQIAAETMARVENEPTFIADFAKHLGHRLTLRTTYSDPEQASTILKELEAMMHVIEECIKGALLMPKRER